MNMIFMLLGFSIILALVFLVAFLWASQSGQNDDLYTPSVRILFDDKPGKEDQSKSDEDHPKP
jgi:cbb3-type cytochrome oxidase maturation protein